MRPPPPQPPQGAPSPLVSSFKLSYYTLLNLMKRPEAGTQDLELVIANSFQQFQRDRAAPKVRARAHVLCVLYALCVSVLCAACAVCDDGARQGAAVAVGLELNLSRFKAVFKTSFLLPACLNHKPSINPAITLQHQMREELSLIEKQVETVGQDAEAAIAEYRTLKARIAQVSVGGV